VCTSAPDVFVRAFYCYCSHSNFTGVPYSVWYTQISDKEKQPDVVGDYKVILQPDMVMRRSLIKYNHKNKDQPISLPDVSLQKSSFTADSKFMGNEQRPQFIFVPEEDEEYKALSAYKNLNWKSLLFGHI
jgi:hypothetical protein